VPVEEKYLKSVGRSSCVCKSRTVPTIS
jgi:hypothetical protein